MINLMGAWFLGDEPREVSSRSYVSFARKQADEFCIQVDVELKRTHERLFGSLPVLIDERYVGRMDFFATNPQGKTVYLQREAHSNFANSPEGAYSALANAVIHSNDYLTKIKEENPGLKTRLESIEGEEIGPKMIQRLTDFRDKIIPVEDLHYLSF